MVYTVTLMNPLASGSDGSWHLDLLMEAVVGETPVEPLSPANDSSAAPPCDAMGNGAATATAGGGSGGEASTGKASNPLPPVDDVSDDDSERCGDEERQKRGRDGGGAASGGAGARGGALRQDGHGVAGAGGAGSGGDGAGGGGVLPGDGRAVVEGAERVEVEVLEISDDSLDDSADDRGTDNEEGDEEQASNSFRQQGAGANPAAALETETLAGAAGFDDEQISSDEVSSEDEPIGRAGKASRPEKGALPAPPAQENDRASGTSVERPPPATPPARHRPPSSATSAASSARSPLDKNRSSDSFASQTPESMNDDDSSFDESERGSEDSSDADMDYDGDGFEVDVPFPPCSVIHKERRTYKQSLCRECFETYTRDLQRAGVHRSDVDSDSGRTISRNRTRSRRLRRQPQRERAASSVGKPGMVDQRASRRLRRESRESNNGPNSDRKERHKNRSAAAASARLGGKSQQEKIPKKKSAAGGENGKVKFPRMKRRLSKEGGMHALRYSSSEAAGLDDSSGSDSCGSGNGSKINGDAQRDKPRAGDRGQRADKKLRAVNNPSVVGKTVVDILHTDSSDDDTTPSAVAPAPGPVPAPARLGSNKRFSKQATAEAAATNSGGRGSDDFLGVLMDGPPLQRATSVDSLFPLHHGSHPKLKKRLSSDNLQGRANAAEGSGLAGRDRLPLKRTESLDTATFRRDGLPANGCTSPRPESPPGQGTRPLRSIPELSSSQPEHRSTASATVGAPAKKMGKRRAEVTDSRRPKPGKARPDEKEGPPAPIPKKSPYTMIPHFEGVVRKYSNSKYFLWVHDKLHDGKPYDSAELCAKEYAKLTKLTRTARESQKGPRRNSGDSRAPSHAEIPGLTQLSQGDGGSRIAKKSLTSAYSKGQPAPAPANKATKNLFFAPKERPLPAPRQQAQPPPRQQPQPPSRQQPQRPPASGPLHAPPVVPSYDVSDASKFEIDPSMQARKSETGGGTNEGRNQDQPALAYPLLNSISWAVTTETFRPVDGLHVPGDIGVLPRRSGLVGGRQGRPAPDTRWSCAQTGISREEVSTEKMPVGPPEDSLADDGATKPGLNPTSASDENATRAAGAATKAVPSTPTPGAHGAMPMSHTGPVTPRAPTPPQHPVPPTAGQVSAPVSSPLTEAPSSAQGPANGSDRDRAKLSVSAAAPTPNVANGGVIITASGLGEESGAAVAVAVGGKHKQRDTAGRGTGAGAEVGEAGEDDDREVECVADGARLHNGGEISTAAVPVAPTVLLSDRLAQVRRKAENSPREAGSSPPRQQQPAEEEAAPVAPSGILSDRLAQVRRKAEGSPRRAGLSPPQKQNPTEEEAEGNRDEEDGRELLLSMMMNGGPVNDADDVSADDEMELCSEAGAEDAIEMERTYPADVVQLSYSEGTGEHSDALRSAYCTQEEEAQAEEDENVDGTGEPPGFEKFLADIRSSRQVPPVGAPAAAPSADGATVEDDPVPLPLLTAAAGEVNGDVRDTAPTMPSLPSAPVAQVPWSTPLEVSRRVNTNKVPVGGTVSPRTAWVQPRRLGGSSGAGLSTAAPCATSPLPPGEELKPLAENVAARSLSGAHEMPAPSDPSLLPNGTVAKVAWRAPSRLAPIVANAIRPAVRFDRQPERQGGGVPPSMLQLPPEVAELLGEATVESGADDGAIPQMPRAPLELPDLLASPPPPPPSRTQGLVPPSTPGSSTPRCDEKEEVVEAEQVLPPSGPPEQPPGKLGDETPGQVIDPKLKAMILARANAREMDPAATTKPAVESVLGDSREANGHSQGNGHCQVYGEANGHPESNGQGQAHDGRKLVEEKPAAPCSSRDGSRPALDANPLGFRRYPTSSSPSRRRSRSDSSRRSNRGSSSSSGIRERRRHGEDDRPRSRDSPRHSPGESSSCGSSSRQKRRYDGRDDHDRPRSRDDGHHRRRYEDFGRSGSRGSSDSSGRSRREDSRYNTRDDLGRGGWRDGDYDSNRVRRGGFDSRSRSPRDGRRYRDSKRQRRKRSLSPQRDWRR